MTKCRFWFVLFFLIACTGSSSTNSNDTNTCTLTENTTATSTVTDGCTLIERDTSDCEASRTAQGLSGAWLEFSCRVDLTVVTIDGADYVELSTDSQPDYTSNYFETDDPCYEAFSPDFPNPNMIAAQTIVMDIPLSPNTANETMNGGAVGVAINGVVLFSNFAAPGDDIYEEAESFDECQGHPNDANMYHYHSEPYSISVNDSNLIGVMRDGYFLYGRLDADGSTPTLDSTGGHSGTTAESPDTSVFHYHVNLQTSTNEGTAGTTAEFLTTGIYEGTPGDCSGCE